MLQLYVEKIISLLHHWLHIVASSKWKSKKSLIGSWTSGAVFEWRLYFVQMFVCWYIKNLVKFRKICHKMTMKERTLQVCRA